MPLCYCQTKKLHRYKPLRIGRETAGDSGTMQRQKPTTKRFVQNEVRAGAKISQISHPAIRPCKQVE